MARVESIDSTCDTQLEEQKENTATSLLVLQEGEKGIIQIVKGGRGACQRLNELGLVPGIEIEVVNKISSGPVMIKVRGSKLAIGRGLANKIYVTRSEERTF